MMKNNLCHSILPNFDVDMKIKNSVDRQLSDHREGPTPEVHEHFRCLRLRLNQNNSAVLPTRPPHIEWREQRAGGGKAAVRKEAISTGAGLKGRTSARGRADRSWENLGNASLTINTKWLETHLKSSVCREKSVIGTTKPKPNSAADYKLIQKPHTKDLEKKGCIHCKY